MEHPQFSKTNVNKQRKKKLGYWERDCKRRKIDLNYEKGELKQQSWH